ncbi:four helix bundle protein [Fodinibius saliphilus]|nr:four helix bundle protein [Fodinibius saliphilus]
MEHLIGANLEEAIGAQSRKDFKAKLSFYTKKPDKHIPGSD